MRRREAEAEASVPAGEGRLGPLLLGAYAKDGLDGATHGNVVLLQRREVAHVAKEERNERESSTVTGHVKGLVGVLQRREAAELTGCRRDDGLCPRHRGGAVATGHSQEAERVQCGTLDHLREVLGAEGWEH
jgi:hypothetical protein